MYPVETLTRFSDQLIQQLKINMEATEQLGWNLTSWYKNRLVSRFLNFKSEDFFESKMKAKHAMVEKSHKMV